MGRRVYLASLKIYLTSGAARIRFLLTYYDSPANQRQNARLFTICLHFLLHLSSLLRTDSAPVFCYNYIT